MKLRVRDLSVARDKDIVIKGLSFEFEGPGLLQVIGPNGAGKTTLFETIIGFLKPISGEIRVEGVPRERAFAYMPQDIDFPRDTSLTVREFVEVKKKVYRGVRRQAYDHGVEEALEFVGLERGLWSKRIIELSRGQLQRALLARTIVSGAPILLLDEPLSNVDPGGRIDLSRVIADLSKTKMVLVSSHDPYLLLPSTNRILLMNRGEYKYGSPTEVLSFEYLQKIYSGCLIALKEMYHIADWH